MRKRSNFYLFSFFLVWLFASLCVGQEKIRTVERGKYKSNNEPIAIEYELNDKPLLRGGQIADPNWLKQLTLRIKNISEKTITYFHVQLVIEKQGEMPANWSMVVRFPESSQPVLDAAGKPTGQSRLPILKPGATVKMKISENQLRVLDELKKLKADDIERVSVDIRYVYYDDDTGWSLGREVKRDPNNRNRWIPIRDVQPMPALMQRFATWISSFFGDVGGHSNSYSLVSSRGYVRQDPGFFCSGDWTGGRIADRGLQMVAGPV